MKTVRLLLVLAIVIVSAVGCGGGGGGSNPGGGDKPITGEPVWNAWSGSVVTSTTATFPNVLGASLLANMGNGLKELLAAETFVAPIQPVSANKSLVTFAFDSDVWDSASFKFIFLDWEPLTGAAYYLVYFLRSDGSWSQVWDSREEHQNDPVYPTKAYLDLSDELAGEVGAAGRYQFKVIAKNSSYSKEYPVVTVSLGILMDGVPVPQNYNIATPDQLSWTRVNNGAIGYKLAIYTDATLRKRVWYSGDALLPAAATSKSFDPSWAVTGHYWVVFAYAEENGRTAEINYAMSGF